MPQNPSQQGLFDFSSELDVSAGPTGLAPDLLKETVTLRKNYADKIVSGKCKSLESYADAVGFVRALDWVLDYAERKRIALEAELGTPITEEES